MPFDDLLSRRIKQVLPDYSLMKKIIKQDSTCQSVLGISPKLLAEEELKRKIHKETYKSKSNVYKQKIETEVWNYTSPQHDLSSKPKITSSSNDNRKYEKTNEILSQPKHEEHCLTQNDENKQQYKETGLQFKQDVCSTVNRSYFAEALKEKTCYNNAGNIYQPKKQEVFVHTTSEKQYKEKDVSSFEINKENIHIQIDLKREHNIDKISFEIQTESKHSKNIKADIYETDQETKKISSELHKENMHTENNKDLQSQQMKVSTKEYTSYIEEIESKKRKQVDYLNKNETIGSLDQNIKENSKSSNNINKPIHFNSNIINENANPHMEDSMEQNYEWYPSGDLKPEDAEEYIADLSKYESMDIYSPFPF